MSPHELVLPWNPKQQRAQWHRLHTKRHRRQHQEYIQYVKYGVGIAAGISVVGWLKRKIKQLPVVGLLASPFLSLMPTVLLGSAVGAAVVYGIDEGDPMVVQKKVLPKVKQQLEAAHRDVVTVAADLQRNMRDIQGQSNEALRGLTRTLDAAAAEAEVSLAPIAKRHAQQAQKQLQQLDQQWTAAAADFERSSRNQQQEQQQGWSRRTQHHHQLKAASSDGGWDD